MTTGKRNGYAIVVLIALTMALVVGPAWQCNAASATAGDAGDGVAATGRMEPDIGEDDAYEYEEDADAARFLVADPLAPWNRLMFEFNDRLYFWVLKPLAKGYKVVVPSPVRVGIGNFFTNLLAPQRFVACLLQGKGVAAEAEMARFLANTTIGVLGFMTPAKDIAILNPPPEDLGQTLGVYGIGNGIYIVWPFFGASTLRDTVGMIGDRFLSPLTYLEPLEAAGGATLLDTVNDTSFRLGDYEAFKESALIPYEAFRNAYIQYREKKIAQ